jgi:hypothetical protein
MFVPVACSACGKPFQVPEATVGKPTVCPWCQATVLALPVGVPAAVPSPEVPHPTSHQEVTEPEPLPLEDAPPDVPPASVPKSRSFRLWVLALLLVAVTITASGTIAYLRYKQGHITTTEWTAFTPQDNSCTVELLGRPTEDTETQPGERRYYSTGWYSGTVAWVGWRDLNQMEVQLANTKEAWRLLAPVFDAERKRLITRHEGSVTKDATTKFEDPLTHEVRLDGPKGQLIERIIASSGGSHPRVYFVGMSGKNLDPDGADAKRLFESFKVAE